ncbi:MAG: PilZ domain-containing protein [Myxococcaceae bacterium]|nr:PilZ domain-containing protein [Myxococcaceae bacterium]
MKPVEDKRLQRRIPVDIWMEVEGEGGLYYQRASNLSVGGAYFTQTFPLPFGSRAHLRFTLPGASEPIECQAEIVNTKELGMGVRFLDLKPEDLRRIESLIDSHPGA